MWHGRFTKRDDDKHVNGGKTVRWLESIHTTPTCYSHRCTHSWNPRQSPSIFSHSDPVRDSTPAGFWTCLFMGVYRIRLNQDGGQGKNRCDHTAFDIFDVRQRLDFCREVGFRWEECHHRGKNPYPVLFHRRWNGVHHDTPREMYGARWNLPVEDELQWTTLWGFWDCRIVQDAIQRGERNKVSTKFIRPSN